GEVWPAAGSAEQEKAVAPTGATPAGGAPSAAVWSKEPPGRGRHSHHRLRSGSGGSGNHAAAGWRSRPLSAPSARGSGDIILGGNASRGPVRSPLSGRRLCFATPPLPVRRPSVPGVYVRAASG